MERRFIFVLARRAIGRIIKDSAGVLYWDHMFVVKSHRRSGLGTEIIKFAASHLAEWPALDIRHQSKVAQRIAVSLGYNKIGKSDRYLGCELWIQQRRMGNFPASGLRIISTVSYYGKKRRTEVHYLCEKNDPRHPSERQRGRQSNPPPHRTSPRNRAVVTGERHSVGRK